MTRGQLEDARLATQREIRQMFDALGGVIQDSLGQRLNTPSLQDRTNLLQAKGVGHVNFREVVLANAMVNRRLRKRPTFANIEDFRAIRRAIKDLKERGSDEQEQSSGESLLLQQVKLACSCIAAGICCRSGRAEEDDDNVEMSQTFPEGQSGPPGPDETLAEEDDTSRPESRIAATLRSLSPDSRPRYDASPSTARKSDADTRDPVHCSPKASPRPESAWSSRSAREAPKTRARSSDMPPRSAPQSRAASRQARSPRDATSSQRYASSEPPGLQARARSPPLTSPHRQAGQTHRSSSASNLRQIYSPPDLRQSEDPPTTPHPPREPIPARRSFTSSVPSAASADAATRSRLNPRQTEADQTFHGPALPCESAPKTSPAEVKRFLRGPPPWPLPVEGRSPRSSREFVRD